MYDGKCWVCGIIMPDAEAAEIERRNVSALKFSPLGAVPSICKECKHKAMYPEDYE